MPYAITDAGNGLHGYQAVSEGQPPVQHEVHRQAQEPPTDGFVWEAAQKLARPYTQAERDALALAAAMRRKAREIERAFEDGSRRDVTVEGVVYGGGMTSALLIDGTTRKNKGRGKGSAKVWPKGNRQGLQLTVEQAENVSFEITAQVERDYETLQTLLNTVETSTSVAAVEAIDIPPEWL